jgi:hypothetical protein
MLAELQNAAFISASTDALSINNDSVIYSVDVNGHLVRQTNEQSTATPVFSALYYEGRTVALAFDPSSGNVSDTLTITVSLLEKDVAVASREYVVKPLGG